jgi:lipopolysaccharide biosynthesis glycosyltransferase
MIPRLKASLFMALFTVWMCVSSAYAELCRIGDEAEVLWQNNWYKATVQDVSPDKTQCYIHYEGYDKSWDEWVKGDRIRITHAAPKWRVGNKVEVLWQDKWYPATIVSVGKDTYFIHYEGYEKSWDEWVTPNRVR